MAVNYKILGQAAPAAATETVLYTVASGQTVLSTIIITNRSSSSGTVRVSQSVSGAATTDKDYLIYDQEIEGNDCAEFTVGLTLGTGDVIRVYASTANFSFNCSGKEIT